MSNLPHFEKLFPAKNFKNNSGWLFWGEEIEKWLAFIDDKDSGYYKENENKFCGEKQCDEPLGEYKAAYFIEKMCGGSIVEFRPRWQKNSELDFRFQDKNEIDWFVEVKSPSWRGEISKRIDEDFFKELRKEVSVIDGSKYPKCKLRIICPSCAKETIFKVENIGDKENVRRVIKGQVCVGCKKRIWNLTEAERKIRKEERMHQSRSVNGECASYSAFDAIEDAIRKSVKQFKSGENNLLIVVPNMLALEVGSQVADGQSNKVRDLLEKYDKNKIIKAIIILEIFLPENSETIIYHQNRILIGGDFPALNNGGEMGSTLII